MSKRFLVLSTFLFVFGISSVPAADLFDNIGRTTGSTSLVLGNVWSANRFDTNGQDYDLVSVTLLMDRSEGGDDPILEIYSDSAGEPGTSIGILTAPGSYSSGTLTNTTFTASGISLTDSSYWVVLKSPNESSTFRWASTDNDTGSGEGFSTWNGQTGNAGANWLTYTVDPYQMIVTVQPVPEPSSLILAALGLGTLRLIVKRPRRSGGRIRNCRSEAVGGQ